MEDKQQEQPAYEAPEVAELGEASELTLGHIWGDWVDSGGSNRRTYSY